MRHPDVSANHAASVAPVWEHRLQPLVAVQLYVVIDLKPL